MSQETSSLPPRSVVPQGSLQASPESASRQDRFQRSSPARRQAGQSADSKSVGSGDTNPFSRQSLIAKRQAIIGQLREERQSEGSGSEVSEPAKAEPQQQAVQEEKSESKGASAGTSERGADTGKQHLQEPSSEQQAFQRRERDVAEAQARVQAATSEAEKRSAKAEADEAKAQSALQKLEWAKSDPVEFLAQVGMSKEEWSDFLAGGGKSKPETQRIKAMEAKFAALEENYRKLEARAEASAKKSSLDAENAAFMPKLNEYTLVSALGGLDQVRVKQQHMSQAQGSQVSLTEAANALEAEFLGNLTPFLKNEAVQRKLNIAIRDQSSVDKPPQAKTQNGSTGAKLEPTPPEDPPAGPWNWAERKRQALKTLSKASL